jgi:hypothetical protein
MNEGKDFMVRKQVDIKSRYFRRFIAVAVFVAAIGVVNAASLFPVSPDGP